MVKQRVGQRPADALLEQDEHGGHALTLVREAVTVPSAIAFQQAVALHLAQVIAELGEGVLLRREAKGGLDRFVDLRRPPADNLRAAVEQHFHQAHHAGVLDLDAWNLAAANLNGQCQALEQREVDMDVEQAGLKVLRRSVPATSLWRKAFRFSKPFFSPRSLSRLTQISSRRKVANFSYIRATRLLQ